MIRLGSRPVQWALGVLLWAVAEAHAAPPEAAPAPDADFLEFLGSWHTGESRWVDPFHAADVSDAETVDAQKDRRPGQPQSLPRADRRESRDGAEQPGTRQTDPIREMKP